jgi:hypothetical protein
MQMIDVLTKEPLRVSVAGGDQPFIRLAVSQLDEVQRRLDRSGVRYWVDSLFISFNGGPETTTIYLYRETDPKAVQILLDKADG